MVGMHLKASCLQDMPCFPTVSWRQFQRKQPLQAVPAHHSQAAWLLGTITNLLMLSTLFFGMLGFLSPRIWSKQGRIKIWQAEGTT